MKIETYLNAYAIVIYGLGKHGYNFTKRCRQRDAFRARILRMDAEKEGVIVVLETGIKYLNEKIAKKDAEIARLRQNNQTFANNAIAKSWDTPEEDEAWKDL